MFRRKDESEEFDFENELEQEVEIDMSVKNEAVAAEHSAPVNPSPLRSSAPMVAQPYRKPASAQSAAPAQQQQAAVPSQGYGSAAASNTASDYRPAVPSSTLGSSSSVSKAGKRILTVGSDILLKGEISTCDRLVIEGAVDATLKDVHTVEIAEHGSFRGTAEVEDAEISGLFDGDLIVRNRLTIYATGKVRGRISYGEIEIERGGELSGEISFGRVETKSKRVAA